MAATKEQEAPQPYQVRVSIRFIILTFASTALLSFMGGRAVRALLLEGPSKALLWPHLESSMRNRPDYHSGTNRKNRLPTPQMMEGRDVPRTVYTSKNFDTAASATSSSMLIEKNPASSDGAQQPEPTCAAEGGSCTRGKNHSVNDADADEDDDEDEEHLPAGQHLLVDIKDVDGHFLNSEERLAQAMVDVVADSKLTLLSYHCHTLVPNGVSCVGVLLESHISFHTWPNEGVITLDLFTCGSNPLLPVVQVIERLFAVPRVPQKEDEEVPKPGVLWSHKLRGFRPEKNHGDTEALASLDLGDSVLGSLDFNLKKELVSVQTPFQRIDIYNLINPVDQTLASYHRSLSNDGSYEAQNPELYKPNKVVFLDGVMQSTLNGDAGYHESLVHPGMFAHSKPKRVGIIGGGEGATLREVLKHDTVEKCTMVEIDELMVNVSRDYLQEWSDCSDIIGSADWCVDDPRADVRYEDAVAWFKNRFYEGDDDDDEDSSDDEEEKQYDEDDYVPFDVIIMDALDPQVNIPFAEVLYQDPAFLSSVYDALNDDGIFVMQLGDSPFQYDPPDQSGRSSNRAQIMQHLEDFGFAAMHVYEEFHSGFGDPWSYLVAMKNYSSRSNWYRNAAEVEVAIHERIRRTHSGKDALKFFDGATMMSIQAPYRGFQTVFCRTNPTPEECKTDTAGYFDSVPNAEVSSFEVRTSQIGDHAGRGVFAKVDIPKGTLIARDQTVKAISVAPATYDIVMTLHEELDGTEDLEAVESYLHGYGFVSNVYGKPSVEVDSGIMTFVNHGCNGTYNMGAPPILTNLTEMTASLDSMPEEYKHDMEQDPYNVVIARHLQQYLHGGEFALRDIKAGEEILNNYLSFIGTPEDWRSDMMDLRQQCTGKGVGAVKDYEDGNYEGRYERISEVGQQE